MPSSSIPSVEEVCAASGCLITDIDVLAVDVGPGLFTGLRVGVATAKALGQALSVGLVGVSSLDILAAAVLAPDRSEPDGPALPPVVAAVVDARRGEVFAAAYVLDAAGTHPTDPAAVRHDRPEPISPEALEAWLLELASIHGTVAVVGDGAVRYHEQLADHAGLEVEGPGGLSAPPPLALARLALTRLADGAAPTAAADLVPDYRRPADARINWEQRSPRTDPGAAQAPR